MVHKSKRRDKKWVLHPSFSPEWVCGGDFTLDRQHFVHGETTKNTSEEGLEVSNTHHFVQFTSLVMVVSITLLKFDDGFLTTGEFEV